MARSKAIELASGESITVNALKLRDQKFLVSLVSDLVRLIGSLAENPESMASNVANFVDEKWDQVVALVEKSLPNPEEADKIVGIDDMVEIIFAIYEVNGVPNLLRRLSPAMEGMAQTVSKMVEQVSAENLADVVPLKQESN